MYFLRYIVLFFLAIQNFGLYAQIHCASVELILDEEDNNEFTFDDFSTYSSGYARTTVCSFKSKSRGTKYLLMAFAHGVLL